MVNTAIPWAEEPPRAKYEKHRCLWKFLVKASFTAVAHLTRARKTVSKDTAPFSFLFSHFGGSAGGRIKSFVCSVGGFLSGTTEGPCFWSQRFRNARTLTPDFPLFTTSYSSLPFTWKCTTNKSRHIGCNSFARVLILIFGLFRTVLGQILEQGWTWVDVSDASAETLEITL